MRYWLSARSLLITTSALVWCVALGIPSARGASAARSTSAAQTSNARRSAWDGVYTETQAKRGQTAYGYSCARCHSPQLEGDPSRDVPALSGDQFVGAWSKRTVKDLLELTSKSMPQDEPASLRPQTYVDIVAYVLWTNEFPAGDEELQADVAALERINVGYASAGAKQ